MEYKYQLIILGSYIGGVKEITDLFSKRLDELNLQKDFYQIIFSSDFDKEYRGCQPTFTIYFGNQTGDFLDLEKLKSCLMMAT